MSTLIDLVSQSLTRLGPDTIASFEEGSPESETMGLLWEPVLNRCLNRAPWRFAEQFAELSRLLATPTDPRYGYQFQLPTDYRRTIMVTGVGNFPLSEGQYTRRGNVYLSTYDRLFLVYGRKYSEVEVPELPEWFGQFFVCSLAYEASARLAVSNSDGARMKSDAALALEAAIQADRDEAPARSYMAISAARAVRHQ